MSLRLLSRLRIVLLWLSLFAPSSFAQSTLSGTQEIRAYRYGIGRIAWTIPKELEVIFAVPHWTAGPRIMCANKRYECEIEVQARDISVSTQERLLQLEETVKPFLPQATETAFLPSVRERNNTLIYTTLQDSRQNEPFRYLTVGYALRGPAVLKFQAATNNAGDLAAILDLVSSVKALDASTMWTFRFSDYKAVCEDRFAAYKAANNAAFAASPFAKIDLVRFFMEQNPSRTVEGTRKELDAARAAYASNFDTYPRAKQRSFCADLPSLISQAAKETGS